MQRDVGTLERDQQFVLVGVQPGEQAVEGHERGGRREDPIEAPVERALAGRGRVAAAGLEVGVEPPQPRPDPLQRRALSLGEADQGMDQALGVDPTERVMAALRRAQD